MGFRFQYLRGDLLENRAYGNQAVLARACGVRTEQLKIFARYQHGFGISAYWPDDRIPSISWSKHVENAGRRQGFFDIYSIGSPIIYFDSSQFEITKFTRNYNNYSLCIAPHSVFNSDRNIFQSQDFKSYFPGFDGENAIEFFAKKCLDESNYPPLVLLYYKDATPKVTLEFKRMGLEVVTLGDGVFDKTNQENYFNRLVELLIHSQEMLVCDASTLWVYGGYLKKRIKSISDSNFNMKLEKVVEFFDGADPGKDDFFELLNGKDSKKSREELMQIFGSNSMQAALKRRMTFARVSAKNGMRKILR